MPSRSPARWASPEPTGLVSPSANGRQISSLTVLRLIEGRFRIADLRHGKERSNRQSRHCARPDRPGSWKRQPWRKPADIIPPISPVRLLRSAMMFQNLSLYACCAGMIVAGAVFNLMAST